MDDDSLMAVVANGDHVALRKVFTRHAAWLAARLRRLLPADAVEDVLQEPSSACGAALGATRPTAGCAHGCGASARRQAALCARKTGHADVTAEPAGCADPATIAIANVDLDRALATLGPAGNEQRELARLVFVEDRSMADVAAHLGIPTGTVKSRVYKVRHLLQAALRQGGR